MSDTKAKKSFGKKMQELESIIEWFESGDPDIDEAIEKYEKALKLISDLKTHLKSAQNKVTKIDKKFLD